MITQSRFHNFSYILSFVITWPQIVTYHMLWKFLGFSDGHHLPITDSSKLCIFNLIAHMSLHTSEGTKSLVLGLQGPTLQLSSLFAQARLCLVPPPVLPVVVSSVRWNSLLQVLQRCLAFGDFLQRGFWKGEFLGYAWDTERRAMFPTSVQCLIRKSYLTKHLGLNGCKLGLSPGLVCQMRRQDMT